MMNFLGPDPDLNAVLQISVASNSHVHLTLHNIIWITNDKDDDVKYHTINTVVYYKIYGIYYNILCSYNNE